MTGFKPTKLDPALNIHGSTSQIDTLVLSDEANQLGSAITGQTGTTASITSVTSGLATITGLTGMVDDSVTRLITISNATSPNNNGTFQIVYFISSSSVIYSNSLAVIDPNNGNIHWTERNNYSLQDDLNYARTDRTNIKGVSYSSNLPVYQRPDALGTNIPINLTNVINHTTDAVAYVMDRGFLGVSVLDGYTKVTLVSSGNLKHADNVNTTGVPVLDVGPFASDYASCSVSIRNATVADGELSVQAGPHIGEKVIGLTYNGASISPNSVEVRFYSVPPSTEVDGYSITPYTWEVGQPTTVNMFYGYNQRLDSLDKNVFRAMRALGAVVETVDYDFLLDNVPNNINYTYTNTLTNGKTTQEKWVVTNTGILFKTIDYTYNGSIIASEVRKIYDITGLVTVAQMTINYVIYNNTVTSATITRDV